MIYGLDQYRDYFANLQQELAAGGTFVFGGSERVLRLQAEDIDYPLVWLAWPVMEALPSGNERFTADLFFFRSASNDQQEEDAALLAMYDLATRWYKRMKTDDDAGLFMLEGSGVFQPKFRTTADNMAGYVLEASLTLGTSGCLDLNNF